MTRVVVDANFLGRGHFNADWIVRLGDTLGTGVDIVIPEVVIWEWSEHAASAIEALIGEHEGLRVDPLLYESPPLPDTPTREALVAAIERSLPQRVSVSRPDRDELHEAISAQVLQIGTGERKSGVKTGAADQLVLCCLRSEVASRENAEAVVLATGDKRLRKACEAEFGDEVLYAGSEYELVTRLREFTPADDELFEATEETLRERIRDTASDIGSALESFGMGFEVKSRRGTVASNERELARLHSVDIVELHDLKLDQREPENRAGYADVRIFGDVHMTVFELVRDGRESSWKQSFSGVVAGGMIDLQVYVTFDSDWTLQSVAPASSAEIDFDQFDDEIGGEERLS